MKIRIGKGIWKYVQNRFYNLKNFFASEPGNWNFKKVILEWFLESYPTFQFILQIHELIIGFDSQIQKDKILKKHNPKLQRKYYIVLEKHGSSDSSPHDQTGSCLIFLVPGDPMVAIDLKKPCKMILNSYFAPGSMCSLVSTFLPRKLQKYKPTIRGLVVRELTAYCSELPWPSNRQSMVWINWH